MSDEEDWEEDNQPSDAAPIATIHSIKELVPEREDEEEWQFPALDWKTIVPPDTFLWEYMQAVCKDDSPEEYHFWNGLLALGQAIGRGVTLYDDIPVLGNLFVCALGSTGTGKSKSGRHLKKILNSTLPFVEGTASSGCKVVSNPASGEVLISSFENAERSPVAAKPIPGIPTSVTTGMTYPVRGLITFAELSMFASKSSSLGNTLKPMLIEFYDADASISSVSVKNGRREAKDSFASVLSTTQPLALKHIMSSADIESGFLNRWIFVGGVPKKAVAIGGAVIDLSAAERELLAVHRRYGPNFQVEWSDQAAEAFTEFHDRVLIPTKKADETMLLTRIDLTMKKMCLLLTVNKMMSSVSPDTIESLKPIYEYLVACYGISGSAIRTSANEELENAILHAVKTALPKSSVKAGKTNTGYSARDITNAISTKYRGKRRDILDALKHLTGMGELEIAAFKGQDGARADKWKATA